MCVGECVHLTLSLKSSENEGIDKGQTDQFQEDRTYVSFIDRLQASVRNRDEYGLSGNREKEINQ